MDFSIDPKVKRLAMMEKMVYMFEKIMDRYEANLNIGDLEQPMLFPDQEQTQPLQDLDDEQDFKENNEEYCQEGIDCLPIPCVLLLKELYEQAANINKEQYFEETVSHLELTKSEIGEETTQLESLPLCYNSFHIIKEELNFVNLLETTHESHVQNDYYKDQEELFESEKDQEIE